MIKKKNKKTKPFGGPDHRFSVTHLFNAIQSIPHPQLNHHMTVIFLKFYSVCILKPHNFSTTRLQTPIRPHMHLPENITRKPQ